MEDQNKQIAADSQSAPQALSVSAALSLAKETLETLTVSIVGEVSEVSVKAGYKAAYFSIKDEKGSLPCMMWNNRYKAAGIDLSVGQLVLITGRFSLYAAKGRMNFDVFSLALAGEGDLRLKVANIARKLKAEGLTDPARKRALPHLPQRVGLVTSPRSAAVHDVLRTLRRRYPIAQILLAGVPVEGATAPLGIIEGINCVVEAGAEVVLVVRGGGSFEDLMPFNDEALARTIAACPVPVVTGIGHEVDTSIADMVSDLRASTPTAAAEAISPSRESFDNFLSSSLDSLSQSLMRTIEVNAHALANLSDRPVLLDPMLLFASDAQTLDAACERLVSSLPQLVESRKQNCEVLSQQLSSSGMVFLERFDAQFRNQSARLHDLSPLAVLGRGYSITRNQAGQIASSVSQIAQGEYVSVTLSDGSITATVKDILSQSLDAL